MANQLAKNQGYTVLDHKVIADKVRAKLGTEEDPWPEDKEVPIGEIENMIKEAINGSKG